MSEINGSTYALSVLGPARRIEWEGDFPADLRAIVEPVFTPLETLLPTWCQNFSFRHSPSIDKTLQVQISVRNRWAVMEIGPSWLAHTAADRENSMIHEICHVLFEPFQWNAARALDAYAPEGGPGRQLLNQIISDGMEQAVEDIARSYQKLLHRS